MKIIWVVAVLTLLVGSVAAQDAPTVSQTFKPGDTLRYLVRFDGHPDLSRLSLDFGLQGPAKKDQAGFSGGFSLRDLKQLSNGAFEVSGIIPKEVATGTYQLNQLYAVHDPAARSYNATELPKLTINVTNDAGYEFPPLKSITPTK